MALMYDRVVACLSKPSAERTKEELVLMEIWMRKKSKLFEALKPEVLLDVIKHCQFAVRKRNEVIIVQGERGSNFYIILRGKVAVYLKEDNAEPITFEKGTSVKESEKFKLGALLCHMGDGQTFGELALLSEDCVRTASVIGAETCHIIVINRDLYNRSVAMVVRMEYEEKFNFVETHPLFRLWPVKWRKHLAAALTRIHYGYDDPIIRQGDPAQKMYFIISGEVRVTVEPEAQLVQFRNFIEQCANLVEPDRELRFRSPNQQREARLTSLLGTDLKPPETIAKPTASAQRKLTQMAKNNVEKVNVCILGAGQIIGEIELLLNLDSYHGTAVCSHETQTLMLHKMHFDRLFRKRNPRTCKNMLKLLEVRMQRRTEDPSVHKVPLYRCILLKTKDLNGTRERRGDDGKYDAAVANSLQSFHIKMRLNSSTPKPKTSVEEKPSGYTEPVFFTRLRAQLDKSDFFNGGTPFPQQAAPPSGLPLVPSTSPVAATVDKRPASASAQMSTGPKPGILCTLLQITDPEQAKRDLEVSEDELTYLLNLKKRVAREFEEFNPFATLEMMVAEQREGRFSRPCGRSGRSRTRISGRPGSNVTRSKSVAFKSAS